MRYAVIVVIILCGCATPQQKEAAQNARIEAAARTCMVAGFDQHDPGFKECVITLYSNNQAAAQASNDAARAAVIGGSLQLLQAPPAPQLCTSRLINGAIQTICN